MTKEARALTIKTLLENTASGFTKDDQPMLEAMTDARLEALETTTKAGLKTLAATKADAEKVITDHAASTKALSDHAAMIDAKAKKDAEVEPKAAEARMAAAKAAGMTLEEYDEAEFLKTAPQSIRDLAANKKAQDAARKTELVTALKAASTVLTEEQLKAKTLPELETLAQFAKVAVPDFSGRGVAVHQSTEQGANDSFAPPDSYADGIKALQGKK